MHLVFGQPFVSWGRGCAQGRWCQIESFYGNCRSFGWNLSWFPSWWWWPYRKFIQIHQFHRNIFWKWTLAQTLVPCIKSKMLLPHYYILKLLFLRITLCRKASCSCQSYLVPFRVMITLISFENLLNQFQHNNLISQQLNLLHNSEIGDSIQRCQRSS